MEAPAISADTCSGLKIHLSPVFAIYGLIASSIATFITSYSICIATRKHIDGGRFLISDTFRSDPTRAIASFGLSLTSAFAFTVFLCRYLIGKGTRRESIALSLALFGCVCMLGVHAFTLTYSRIVHNSSAFGLFISGISASAIFVSEERRAQGGELTPMIKLRYGLLAVSIVSLLVMMSGFIWNHYAVASAAEISMAFFMFACLSSYFREFRTRHLVLAVLSSS